MRAAVITILIVLVAVGGVFAWVVRRPRELRVMVPMGIYLSFTKVTQQFERTHPNVKFRTTVDTPEAMAQMVEENDRKPDIFISPFFPEVLDSSVRMYWLSVTLM